MTHIIPSATYPGSRGDRTSISRRPLRSSPLAGPSISMVDHKAQNDAREVGEPSINAPIPHPTLTKPPSTPSMSTSCSMITKKITPWTSLSSLPQSPPTSRPPARERTRVLPLPVTLSHMHSAPPPHIPRAFHPSHPRRSASASSLAVRSSVHVTPGRSCSATSPPFSYSYSSFSSLAPVADSSVSAPETGNPSTNWLTATPLTTPHGETPRFSRLSLSSVVMPVSAKEHRKQSSVAVNNADAKVKTSAEESVKAEVKRKASIILTAPFSLLSKGANGVSGSSKSFNESGASSRNERLDKVTPASGMGRNYSSSSLSSATSSSSSSSYFHSSSPSDASSYSSSEFDPIDEESEGEVPAIFLPVMPSSSVSLPPIKHGRTKLTPSSRTHTRGFSLSSLSSGVGSGIKRKISTWRFSVAKV